MVEVDGAGSFQTFVCGVCECVILWLAEESFDACVEVSGVARAWQCRAGRAGSPEQCVTRVMGEQTARVSAGQSLSKKGGGGGVNEKTKRKKNEGARAKTETKRRRGRRQDMSSGKVQEEGRDSDPRGEEEARREPVYKKDSSDPRGTRDAAAAAAAGMDSAPSAPRCNRAWSGERRRGIASGTVPWVLRASLLPFPSLPAFAFASVSVVCAPDPWAVSCRAEGQRVTLLCCWCALAPPAPPGLGWLGWLGWRRRRACVPCL